MSAMAIALHVLAAIIWIGGMFFGFLAVRPALGGLEVLLRAKLWAGIFQRFFPWVWAAILVLLGTGIYMVQDSFDGFSHAPIFVHVMMGLGVLMMLLFAHLFFAPYKRLKRAVASSDPTMAAKAMVQVRILMAVNLIIGVIVVIVAMLGSFAAFN